jgi:hypothetical protein
VTTPIACGLDGAAAVDRLDEWGNALAASVVARHRRSPTELALVLGGDPAGLGVLVQLAQREKACCPFFDFALQIDADAITLTVTVPPDAAPLLDQFAQPGG